ncbi:hypothetical protein K432DRAFT_406736 [Lepidopterella palustris CBS 459.81]|uniref:Uncharacterized protein n=1 Tax=Lepidopterella palustris CBS 459.81 TaxID=1314670 RepID=A0A8E2E652_9PEZI|nr:hypothetical protein K432DRAFT_406736 [Lepidopterella palustris CBS 459.81]
MDVVALAVENYTPGGKEYGSLYMRVVRDLRVVRAEGREKVRVRFYGYMRLALVNRATLGAAGRSGGWGQEDAAAGLDFDVATSLDDLSDEEDERGSAEYTHLRDQHNSIPIDKNNDGRGRNIWQTRQMGGLGEPWYRDPQGFDTALKMMIEAGRLIMYKCFVPVCLTFLGWNCGRDEMDSDLGLAFDDAWTVEHDWEPPPVYGKECLGGEECPQNKEGGQEELKEEEQMEEQEIKEEEP